MRRLRSPFLSWIAAAVAVARLSRCGVRVANAATAAHLGVIDAIVFDPVLLLHAHPVLANPGQIGARNMQIAASLGARSSHPLAHALADMYGGKLIDMDVPGRTGQGAEAVYDGKLVRLRPCAVAPSGALWLSVGDAPPVRFVFANAVSPEAVLAAAQLRQAGYRLYAAGEPGCVGDAKPLADIGIDLWSAQTASFCHVRPAMEGGLTVTLGDDAMAARVQNLSQFVDVMTVVRHIRAR
ncbi:MAG: hypothetical protein KGI37_03875 [Alphaproteobacteria bacterium]|nr:hypothetical protein [Alphaproteobacteria bacterium]